MHPLRSQASTPPATVAPTAEAVGERRYLTVMFCDLVGSTMGIAAKLDAEDSARSRRRLSRCGIERSRGNGRRCRQETRRRHHGALWLSAGAGERCRTGLARRARNPARACRDEPQEPRGGQTGARRPDWPRERRGGGRFVGRNLRRRAQYRRPRAGARGAGRDLCRSEGAAPGRGAVRRRGLRRAS